MTGDRRLDGVGDAHRPRSPWTISRTLRTISQGGPRRTLAAMLVIATFGTPSAAAAQAQEEPRSPDERLAAGLNPFEVPAFALGAQIVLLAPAGALGAGSIAAEVDLGPVHFDALFGLFFDEEGPNSLRGNLRGYYVLHRGPLADFSLGAGGGLGYIEREDEGPKDVVWQITGGAKIRSFLGKNVVIMATLGAALTFIDGDGSLLIGGRLLGSAGFSYFFR